MLQQPDSALVAIQPVLDEIKDDYEALVSLTSKVEAQDTRIRDLQDTNMKLFLAQTGQVSDKEEEEPKKLTFGEKLEALESEE